MVNINALNLMRAAIGSQCKLMNRGVTCFLFGSFLFSCGYLVEDNLQLLHNLISILHNNPAGTVCFK